MNRIAGLLNELNEKQTSEIQCIQVLDLVSRGIIYETKKKGVIEADDYTLQSYLGIISILMPKLWSNKQFATLFKRFFYHFMGLSGIDNYVTLLDGIADRVFIYVSDDYEAYYGPFILSYFMQRRFGAAGDGVVELTRYLNVFLEKSGAKFCKLFAISFTAFRLVDGKSGYPMLCAAGTLKY